MSLYSANVIRADDASDTEDETNQEFLKIVNEAENINIRDEEVAKNFEYAHAGEFTKCDTAERTILHCMTEYPIKRGTPKHDLLKWLLERWPHLLTMKDSNKMTPIQCALKGRKKIRAVFVETALECAREDILRVALGVCNGENYNSLHLAIQAEFRSTELLISKCPDDVFRQQDLVDKNTPLHLAMRRTVVDTIPPIVHPRVAPRAISLDHQKESEEKSASQRKKTDKMAETGLPDRPAKENVKGKMMAPAQSKEGGAKGAGNEDNLLPPISPIARRASGFPVSPAAPAPLPAKQSAPIAEFYLPDVVRKLVIQYPDSLTLKNNKQRTPYQERLDFINNSSAGGSSKASDSGATLTEKAAGEDAIAQYLKYHCLRAMDREKAIKILYERGKDRHIEFDLSGLPTPSIYDTYLERLAKHLEFEDCLQYVALPRLTVERDPRTVSSGRKGWIQGLAEGKEVDCIGLTDAQYIFQWLAVAKSVKKIIKVIVIDDNEIPHSEEAIEKCVSQFEVEIWDWRKFDISSDTIYASAKDVRVVNLYSSGNNAIMREWAGEDGLARLEKLEQVNLIIRKGLETANRRERNIDRFKETFAKNWKRRHSQHRSQPEIKIVLDDQVKSIASGFQGGAAAQNIPIWLQCMDMFADYIAGIADAGEEEIRVAVIDDGVDGFQEHIAENIIAGVSFCRYSDGGDLMNAYYVPSGGHGTMMASLVCRVCPHAKLLIARLDEYKGQNNKRFITARSAALAVHWAIQKRAHIISMSWTIESQPGELDTIEFKQAIEQANAKGIILLCAFSDQGNVASTNCLPGAWQYPMTIGAATSYGSACTWVNKNSVNFLFPGDQVMIDRNPKDSAKPESGSSMATGLAAGLAALLLYIAQLVDGKLFLELRQPDKMKAAFAVMCGDSKYVAVEKWFPRQVAEDDDWAWDAGDGRSKLTKLLELIVGNMGR